MKKLIVIFLASLFLNGCASNIKNTNTIFEDMTDIATGVILEEKEENFEVDCIGDVTHPSGRDIHFKEVSILNDKDVFYVENGVRDGAYRYHAISKDYVENIRCKNQEEFEKIIEKTLAKD